MKRSVVLITIVMEDNQHARVVASLNIPKIVIPVAKEKDSTCDNHGDIYEIMIQECNTSCNITQY